MGFFLEDDDQKCKTQGAQEECALFFGYEMELQLDKGDDDGHGCQEKFDGQAF